MIFDVDYPLEIVRTNRKKTTGLRVLWGKVKLSVPKGLSDETIADILSQRKDWIKERIQAQSNIKQTGPRQFIEGEQFPYLGRKYKLQIAFGLATASKAELKSGRLQVTIPANLEGEVRTAAVKKTLERWYRECATKKLQEKTDTFAQIVGAKPEIVKVRTYKARWGSCSKENVISYNWRIIMTPLRIIDYVVVHELCHLLEHNHSPAFWNQVRCYMPDYEERQKWLHEHGSTFIF